MSITYLQYFTELWATSMTEDIDERDTKKLYRLTLRQFIIYLGFLAILCAGGYTITVCVSMIYIYVI